MTAILKMFPEGYFTNKDLERLLIELTPIVEQKEVMRIEHAMEFLNLSRRQVDEMCRKGQLPYHKLEGLGGKVFLRQELIDFIKRH